MVVPEFVKLLSHYNDEVVKAATFSLGTYENQALAALPTLLATTRTAVIERRTDLVEALVAAILKISEDGEQQILNCFSRQDRESYKIVKRAIMELSGDED